MKVTRAAPIPYWAAFLVIYPHRRTRIFPDSEFGVALHDLLEFLIFCFSAGQFKTGIEGIKLNMSSIRRAVAVRDVL